jgi:hypothetical protein
MSQPSTFIVSDNPDGDRNGDDILVERKFARYTMFWAMPFEDLVALQESIGTFIAGERLG